MKAAVFYDAKDIRLETVPDPTPAIDDVVVRVKACGFCGSDVEYYFGRSPVGTATGKGPLVLGHEMMGEVVELGPLASAQRLFKPGDRVAINPIQSCHACDNCRAGHPQFCANLRVLGVTTNGGFAEYVTSKYMHLYKLPENVSDVEGAFVEMLAAAVNAVQKLAIEPGNFVVISGPGPIGLAMVQLVKEQGAGRVAMIGTRDYRLELARQLGADLVYNVADTNSPHYTENVVEAIREATGGRMAERVIVPNSSIAANQQALDLSGPGSVIVYLGVTGPSESVQVPMLTSLIQDKTIRFSLWYPFQWPKTIQLISQGAVATDKLITHQESLANISGAIERVANRDDSVIKTIITP